jgi:hypothetical protein
MDALLDLTSRAVSLIVLIQDSLIRIKKDVTVAADTPSVNEDLFQEFIRSKEKVIGLGYFQDNGSKISWISIEPPLTEALPAQHCYNRCIELIKWINTKKNFAVFQQWFVSCKYFPAPEQWREAIREVLYSYDDQRILLADALQYLPVQIVLAAGKAVTKLNAKQQRLLQIWNMPDQTELSKVISNADEKKYNALENIRKTVKSTAEKNLKNEEELIQQLETNEVPLSFLQIFNCELLEVHASRECRKKEIINSDHLFTITADGAAVPKAKEETVTKRKEDDFQQVFKQVLPHTAGNVLSEDDTASDRDSPSTAKINYIPDTSHSHDYNKDVLQSAKHMELWALAFSGGGIRSATFNLGILQGLAKKGLLSKFDYLSTVSGGGYIGSWLVSWIARNYSVIKVSERLDPKKSSDPLADEVRPIRWLRMYSNYLTPMKGIMSADSWTVGMTLIRNMLVNQLVILSLLLTLISAGRLFFMYWLEPAKSGYFLQNIISAELTFNALSAAILLAGATLAGLGMHSYHKESFPKINVNPRLKSVLTHLLIGIGCAAALLLSTWIYRHATIPDLGKTPDFKSFGDTFHYLLWVMGVGFIALLFVAILGRYDRCTQYSGARLVFEILLGGLLSAGAVAAGGALLTLICQLAVVMAQQPYCSHGVDHYAAKICFIFLPPLIIEVLSIIVVLRMAFLGVNFPDERREWWGRIGGLVHRICLIWIFLFGITMLGKGLVDLVITERFHIKEFFVVGWGATLLLGIKYAFSGTTSGEDKIKAPSGGIKEKLALLAPYLFLFGLMILLPQLLDKIQAMVNLQLSEKPGGTLQALVLLTVALALLTFLLSRQIGVNQFSMHLFYRNRLVRAFLGATRIRLERQRTANSFTGFDNQDDLLLASLSNEQGYFGPYPLINTTMSASSDSVLDRQDRKAESFIFSPKFSGFDFSRTRASANAMSKSYDYAYRPTGQYGYKKGPHIGTAMAISGAAANPNMGYHTSAPTAFLLSLFNIRLGWWMGNPRMAEWQKADPQIGLGYLISDLSGSTNSNSEFVCLSDGGHFDNMGLYELIRRKCKYIVLSDAEQDETLLCEGLANAVRRCRIDFGVEITFNDIEDITRLSKEHFSAKNYAVGKITYPENEDHEGIIIYIKASMTTKENIDLQEYAKKNPTFPHQSTADQFFDEEQFESYRKLGLNIIDKIIR